MRKRNRRFVLAACETARSVDEAEAPEPYRLFETSEYTVRILITNMAAPPDAPVGFRNRRVGEENPIRGANNDTGPAAHPSQHPMRNTDWFRVVTQA